MHELDPDHSDIDLTVVHEAPCRHLRSKGMYVYAELTKPEEVDDGNTIYWCLQTMKSFGPDDGMVEGHDCRNPGRECYEPI